LQTAREVNADLIGLRRLITPSLDEMAHVAREMERTGCTIPLLIGGATTSRRTRCQNRAALQQAGRAMWLDASRAVGVVSSLLSPELRPAFMENNRCEQQALREQQS